MTDARPTDAERRLAEVMASFGRDHQPDGDRWSTIEDGVTLVPRGRSTPSRRGLAVGLAAAVVLIALVVTAGYLGTTGDDYEVGSGPADEPAASTSTPASDAPPATAGPEEVRACLDERGVDYEVESLEEGEGFALSPPAGATEVQQDAFTEGVEACSPDVSPTADDVADGRAYAVRMETCLEDAGYDPVFSEHSPGGYDIVNGPDGRQTGFGEAIEMCSRQAEQGG